MMLESEWINVTRRRNCIELMMKSNLTAQLSNLHTGKLIAEAIRMLVKGCSLITAAQLFVSEMLHCFQMNHTYLKKSAM